MSRSVRRMFVLAVVLAWSLLAASLPAVSAAEAEAAVLPPDVAELVAEMDGALGGVAGIQTIVVSATGTRWVLDEGERPSQGREVPSDYDLLLSFGAATGQTRLDYDIDSSRFGQRSITEIFGSSAGYLIGQDSNVAPPTASAMLSDRLVSTQVHQLMMNPAVLVGLLLNGEFDATLGRRVLLGSVPHDVLTVERFGAAPLSVFVSRRTHLVTKVETMESDPLRRDVKLVARYSRWRSIGEGVQAPTRVRISYDGELIQDERRHEFVVNGALADGLFDPPPGATPTFDALLAGRGANSHQHLQSFAALGFPLDGLQLDVVGTELAPGVHWLAGGTHHSMLIEQDDGLVLVDAPLNEWRAAALLAYVDANFPGQTITHLVQSHFHVDHAAGARTVLADGADLVVERTARRMWQRVLRADSTVVPDALAASGADIDIITVQNGTSATLGSGENAVGLHSFEQNHSTDLLFVTAGGVGFIVDYFNPFPGAPIPPEGQVVLDLIAERGLDVSIIAGGHGAFISVPGASD